MIDLLPEPTNCWVAGGGNSEAFKSGPVIGEYVAHRIVGIHGDPEIAKGFTIPKDEFPAGGGRGAPERALVRLVVGGSPPLAVRTGARRPDVA